MAVIAAVEALAARCPHRALVLALVPAQVLGIMLVMLRVAACMPLALALMSGQHSVCMSSPRW